MIQRGRATRAATGSAAGRYRRTPTHRRRRAADPAANTRQGDDDPVSAPRHLGEREAAVGVRLRLAVQRTIDRNRRPGQESLVGAAHRAGHRGAGCWHGARCGPDQQQGQHTQGYTEREAAGAQRYQKAAHKNGHETRAYQTRSGPKTEPKMSSPFVLQGSGGLVGVDDDARRRRSRAVERKCPWRRSLCKEPFPCAEQNRIDDQIHFVRKPMLEQR